MGWPWASWSLGRKGRAAAREAHRARAACWPPEDSDSGQAELTGRMYASGEPVKTVAEAFGEGYLACFPSPGEPPPITFRTPLGLDLAVSLSRPVVVA